MPGFEPRRCRDLPGNADQRIFRRLIAVGGRKQRGPENVRIVIGAARRDADEFDAKAIEQREEPTGSARSMPRPVPIAAEGIAIGCREPRQSGAVDAGSNGRKSNDADADADFQARRLGPDAGDDLAKKARAVLQAAAITARPIDGREKLVSQIAVAMLDVDKREAGSLGQLRGADEIVGKSGDIAVAEHRSIVGDAELANPDSGWR